MEFKFKIKTTEELEKMTTEELNAYQVEKITFERKQTEDLIDLKTSELKSQLENVSKKDEVESLKQDIKGLTEQVKNFDKTIVDLQKSKNETSELKMEKKFYKDFKEKYEANLKADDRSIHTQIRLKAFDSENVHSVVSVTNTNFPAPGTTGLSELYRNIMGQYLGIFTPKRSYSKILQLVNVTPLLRDRIIAFNEIIVNGFDVVGECELKPFSRISYEEQTQDVEFIASLWCTTLRLREFYPDLYNRMEQRFEELLFEKIPNEILTRVKTGAIPFTPIAGMAINTAPDNFEAIVKVSAFLQKNNYEPNGLMISNVAYANMITTLGTDGHYKLQNGSSIVLVDGVIKIGNYDLTIIIDNELGDDEFLVGDFSYVLAQIKSDVIYAETDGRIDGETQIKTGLGINIRTHELGQFFAVMIPDSHKNAIVLDTFTNVKSLITLL